MVDVVLGIPFIPPNLKQVGLKGTLLSVNPLVGYETCNLCEMFSKSTWCL